MLRRWGVLEHEPDMQRRAQRVRAGRRLMLTGIVLAFFVGGSTIWLLAAAGGAVGMPGPLAAWIFGLLVVAIVLMFPAVALAISGYRQSRRTDDPDAWRKALVGGCLLLPGDFVAGILLIWGALLVRPGGVPGRMGRLNGPKFKVPLVAAAILLPLPVLIIVGYRLAAAFITCALVLGAIGLTWSLAWPKAPLVQVCALALVSYLAVGVILMGFVGDLSEPGTMREAALWPFIVYANLGCALDLPGCSP